MPAAGPRRLLPRSCARLFARHGPTRKGRGARSTCVAPPRRTRVRQLGAHRHALRASARRSGPGSRDRGGRPLDERGRDARARERRGAHATPSSPRTRQVPPRKKPVTQQGRRGAASGRAGLGCPRCRGGWSFELRGFEASRRYCPADARRGGSMVHPRARAHFRRSSPVRTDWPERTLAVSE